MKSTRIGCAWRWIWTASCTKLFSSDTTVFMFTFCIAWVFQHRTDFCWPVISHSVHVLNLIYFYQTRKTNARMVRLWGKSIFIIWASGWSRVTCKYFHILPVFFRNCPISLYFGVHEYNFDVFCTNNARPHWKTCTTYSPLSKINFRCVLN